MWLKQTYRTHRFTTVVVILFFTVQLLNNIRQDIAISPWYAYGMYSEPAQADSGIRVVTIMLNNHLLNPVDYMPQVWDKMAQPLVLYCNQEAWNQYVFKTDIKRLLPFTTEKNFSNTITRAEFSDWYFGYLENITNQKLEKLEAELATYSFEQGVWQKTAVQAFFTIAKP